MSDVAEGLGGAIEGALTGRAVEPSRGEASSTEADSAACSNCGAIVSGAYCSQCGQKRHVHRSLSAIGHDLIHGVLHLDGKLWDTLPLLTFKPGQLTRRYIDGERAKFVSPMAMLLFSVFAMFAVFQMVGLSTPTNLDDLGTTSEIVRAQGVKEAEELRAKIDAMSPGDPQREQREKELALLERFLTGDPDDPDVAEDDEEALDLRDIEVDFNVTGIDWIDKGIVKKWQENPSLMLYKLQANAYKFSWLLIPLSIPFVWLLFVWKRRFHAYDHAVFVTYSLSFMSMLFIFVSLVAVSPLGPGWVAPILLIVTPLHIYKHLKYTYDLSRFSTIWRFVLLLLFILIVVVLFLQALLLLGGF